MIRFTFAPALSERRKPVRRDRFVGWAALGLLLLATTSCGVSQNPSRIGNLPNGNIIRTHGKPPLWGYWRDFDPNAKTLTVTPKTAINQVGTQHVIVASVCDADGNGRRSRRVEWHVEGAGYIVEVDESGLFPGRGYLVDDKYAVSYTNYKKQTITRGNKDSRDDIELRPGQTYCVIFSPVEGETHVTCYAPGIHDWQKHKVTVTKYWVDAQPIFPPPAVNRAGEPHTFGTRVVRSSDGTGASGYRVRYRVLDGPPALFAGGNAPAVEVITDSAGNGGAVLQQVQPTPGVNRVQIDVLRPSDTPTGREILLSSHITTKTWVAPQISIQKIAPPAVALGSQIPYRIIVTNTGSVATSGLTIRDTIPPSLNLIGSNPPASLQGNTLVWNFGPLPPAQAVAVEFACQATQGGVVANNCAEAGTPDGLRAEACASTQVIAGSLVVDKRGPQVSIVGAPVNFEIVVSNPGTAPVLNVRLIDEFDAGLSHTSGQNALQLPVGDVGPGETKVVPLTLTATVAGRLCNRVRAEGEGGIVAQDEHCVEVSQPQLSIRKTGPNAALIGKDVPFEIIVRNTGNAPAANVLVRDQLPINLQPLSVAGQGAVQGQNAIWSLGVLGPGEERRLGLTARAISAGTNICNTAVLSATGIGDLESDPVCLDIRGVAGMLTELIDRADPVPIGSETTYTIRVTNQGSTPLNNVTVGCVIPPEMEYVDSEGHPATVPAQYDPRSRVLRFKPFNGEDGKSGMAPNGGWLVFQVQVKAIRKGDARFELNVIADQIKKPVVDQESTQCFDPNTGASDGAIIMPKAGDDGLIPASENEVPIPMTPPRADKEQPSDPAVTLPLPTITLEPISSPAPDNKRS